MKASELLDLLECGGVIVRQYLDHKEPEYRQWVFLDSQYHLCRVGWLHETPEMDVSLAADIVLKPGQWSEVGCFLSDVVRNEIACKPDEDHRSETHAILSLKKEIAAAIGEE